MACKCILDFDFSIEQFNCSEVLYIDRSTFQEGSEFSAGGYELTVKGPDSTTTYTVVSGIPLKLNVGKCDTGIFEFSTTTCIDSFSKKAAIICNLYCGYVKAVAKLGQLEVNVIRSIRERIEYIEVIAATDFVTAAKLIRSVERDLERINCSCSCK